MTLKDVSGNTLCGPFGVTGPGQQWYDWTCNLALDVNGQWSTPPTEEPTTEGSTEEPSTGAPTEQPSTGAPTEQPTTRAPTEHPTKSPTRDPTRRPTREPTPLTTFTEDQSDRCFTFSHYYSCGSDLRIRWGSSDPSANAESRHVATSLRGYCPQTCANYLPTPPPTPSPTWTPGTGVAGCIHPAAVYLAHVIAGTSTIFNRDIGVTLQIQYMKVWSGPSPYDWGTQSLGHFRNAYAFGVDSSPGLRRTDLAHLYTGIHEGGVGFLGTVCSQDGSQVGVSSIRGTWTGSHHASHYNWDLVVTAHEIGHNLGSGHTHDMSAYNPQIDQCIGSDHKPVDRQSPHCVRGTIMSYCHLCGGGANIDMHFHERCIARIRSNLNHGICKLNMTDADDYWSRG